MRAKETLTRLLRAADIEVNGNRPWDFQAHDERVFRRIIRHGSLGAGESYMDGWWSSEQADELFHRLLRARLEQSFRHAPATVLNTLLALLFNGAWLRPFQVGKAHYDVGNDLFRRMLDRRMTYTCGYWKSVTSLDQAQEAKLDLVCRKLGVREGDYILDIGSGWGSFINFAAERYGARCLGITVSREQAQYANAHRYNAEVETRLMDYRAVDGRFDHVVSLGMFEHVGRKNYRRFLRKVRSVLADDGLFLLHTIGKDRSAAATDPWIAKYIFPNSMIPSCRQVTGAAEQLFVLEDWHNFGADYDTTLMHWRRNFDAAWDDLRQRYDERFYRMWTYYLAVSAGSFRARRSNLWQIVLSKHGVPGGYRRVD
ncbi:MAG: cyclopropane fatty acyl phospholipid synthase [Xanthomonadales bacterium]|nr:cyclopropane fatty acyl phospholipid synthase [Xanthomonadales bacterium]